MIIKAIVLPQGRRKEKKLGILTLDITHTFLKSPAVPLSPGHVDKGSETASVSGCQRVHLTRGAALIPFPWDVSD